MGGRGWFGRPGQDGEVKGERGRGEKNGGREMWVGASYDGRREE